MLYKYCVLSQGLFLKWQPHQGIYPSKISQMCNFQSSNFPSPSLLQGSTNSPFQQTPKPILAAELGPHFTVQGLRRPNLTFGMLHLGNCTIGKLPLGKLPLGKLPLGKLPLGKYLTSFYVPEHIIFLSQPIFDLILTPLNFFCDFPILLAPIIVHMNPTWVPPPLKFICFHNTKLK